MSNEIGHVENFSPTPFLEAARILIEADEPERALKLLNNLPARYRDFPPQEVTQLKACIRAALISPHAYMSCDLDAKVDREASKALIQNLVRGRVLDREVEALNDAGVKPHIVDMGPGEYWALLGLDALHRRFTYKDVSLLKRTGAEAWDIVGDGHKCEPRPGVPHIFVALEIIEHLADPTELATEALRHSPSLPSYIHLSTPCYTFDGSPKFWNRPNGLPHRRAYTPQEFLNEVDAMFDRQYHWQMFLGPIMGLRGQLKTIPQTHLEI